jgi:gas vesicle protein
MEKSNDTGKIIGAVLLGAAIGAALGVLFAPEKGTATRKKMMDGLKDLADEFKETLKGDGDAPESNTDAKGEAV